MVRSSGFEPPRYCYRQPLKLVRLPVPPRPHRGENFIVAARRQPRKPVASACENRLLRSQGFFGCVGAGCGAAGVFPAGCWAAGCEVAGALPDAGELAGGRSEEHTSELQSRRDLVCRLLLEKKKKTI